MLDSSTINQIISVKVLARDSVSSLGITLAWNSIFDLLEQRNRLVLVTKLYLSNEKMLLDYIRKTGRGVFSTTKVIDSLSLL